MIIESDESDEEEEEEERKDGGSGGFYRLSPTWKVRSAVNGEWQLRPTESEYKVNDK